MDVITKAKILSLKFIKHIEGKGMHGIEEIKISNENNSKFTIKIFVSENQNEIVFRKDDSNSYIIISNGNLLSSRSEEEFDEILDLLNMIGVKFLDKTFKPFTKTKHTKKKRKVVSKNFNEKMKQIDRILDKYNSYKILYEITQDEKYLKRQSKIINLLKKTKPFK